MDNRLKVGSSCNNRCVFCSILGIKAPFDRLSEDIMEDIQSMRAKGYTQVIFPCNADIRKDFKKLIGYARSLGLKVELETNARIFSYEKNAHVASKAVDGFVVFLNSAFPEKHRDITGVDSFDETMKGLRNLRTLTDSIQINTVLMVSNLMEMKEMPRIIDGLGIKRWRIIYPVNEGGIVPRIEDSYREVERAIMDAEKRGISFMRGELFSNPLIPEMLDLDFSSAILQYSNSSEKDIFLSVVIPTFNRKELLCKTFRSLSSQDFPSGAFEVVVVDDGSNDGTIDSLKDLGLGFGIKCIYWPREMRLENGALANRAGPARNLAARHAAGEIILFLDSDMIAAQDLLRMHLEASQAPKTINLGMRLVGSGMIDSRLKRLYDGCENDIMKMKYPWVAFTSNNFSMRKDEFMELGGFSPDFVMWGGEDLDFAYRALGSGYSIQLLVDAEGMHQDHPSETVDKDYAISLFANLMYKRHLDAAIVEAFKDWIIPKTKP